MLDVLIQDSTQAFLNVVTYAARVEYLMGERDKAGKYWRLSFQFKTLIEYVADNSITEDQSVEDALSCLLMQVPPECKSLNTTSINVVNNTTSTTCNITAAMEIICDTSGNPCDGFSVQLLVE